MPLFVKFLMAKRRTVFYFSLQSYSTRNPCTRAVINEGVNPLLLRRCLQSRSVGQEVDLWILREKADCKQSTSVFCGFQFWRQICTVNNS